MEIRKGSKHLEISNRTFSFPTMQERELHNGRDQAKQGSGLLYMKSTPTFINMAREKKDSSSQDEGQHHERANTRDETAGGRI
ncbi:hypothetical protein SUGI_0960840 [Cryptomeria japonica]|nr:hypothetical protein SUGI_0960840 [Cryptomeria japonica]